MWSCESEVGEKRRWVLNGIEEKGEGQIVRCVGDLRCEGKLESKVTGIVASKSVAS